MTGSHQVGLLGILQNVFLADWSNLWRFGITHLQKDTSHPVKKTKDLSTLITSRLESIQRYFSSTKTLSLEMSAILSLSQQSSVVSSANLTSSSSSTGWKEASSTHSLQPWKNTHTLFRSLMWIRNSSGRNVDPWGHHNWQLNYFQGLLPYKSCGASSTIWTNPEFYLLFLYAPVSRGE